MEPTACPWHGLEFTAAAFCEESVCGWVRQPGNTVSNLGFLLVGWLIYRHARHHGHGHLMLLAAISVATGLTSAFFHASETRLGAILDFSGIYLGSAYMFAMNVRRLTQWRKGRIVGVYLLFFGVSFALLLLDPDLSRKFYALQSFACCVVLEAILFFTQKGRPDYRWFGAFWGSFLLGYGLWLLDVQHLVCDPTNHWISGHALWHWLDALALYCVYRFYTQFRLLRFEDSRSSGATAHRDKGSPEHQAEERQQK